MFTCPRWRVEMGAVGRQLDQMDTAGCPCKKSPDIGPFMVGGVVPDDMNDALIGVVRFNLGQKLHRTDPIDAQRLNKGRIESLEVQGAMNVHAATPRRAENRWI